MSIECTGITQYGGRCQRKIKKGSHCYQHRPTTGKCNYKESKPSECIICYESLANQRRALECGHWIHITCIINSAKAECPICRTKLTLGKRTIKHIEKLAKRRKAETIQEEHDELRTALQYHVAGLIGPALDNNLQELLEHFLEEEFFDNLSSYEILFETDFLIDSDDESI